MDVPIGRIIDWEDEGINEIVVQILMEQIKKGESLPSPVLMESPGGYIVVDGRNRIAAAQRCGETEIDAFVIEQVSDEELRELRSGLNEDRNSN